MVVVEGGLRVNLLTDGIGHNKQSFSLEINTVTNDFVLNQDRVTEMRGTIDCWTVPLLGPLPIILQWMIFRLLTHGRLRDACQR